MTELPMKIQFRKTIKTSGMMEGVGLHSGEKLKLIFHPSESHTGIIFYQKSSNLKSSLIPANVFSVIDTSLAVTLGNGSFFVQTVEHLMFAIFCLGITDMLIEIQGSTEIPIADGSALPFIDTLEALEFHEYCDEILPIQIDKPIMVTDGDRYLVGLPHDQFKISYSIDYPHPMLKDQALQVEFEENFFKKEIGRARTFGFLKDVDYLKKNGLAQGGSTVNVLIFTPDKTLNESRFPQEPLYHKILDLVGDLALISKPIKGHILGSKGGHALDVAFGKKLLREYESQLSEAEFKLIYSSPNEKIQTLVA